MSQLLSVRSLSMGELSVCGSGSLHKSATNMLAGDVVISGLNSGKICFQPRIASSSWQALALSSDISSLSLDLTIGQFTAWQVALLRASGRVHPRQKPQSFCNLFSEEASHWACSIPFLRNKLIGPVHTQRQGATQGCRHQEGGSWEISERLSGSPGIRWGYVQNAGSWNE